MKIQHTIGILPAFVLGLLSSVAPDARMKFRLLDRAFRLSRYWKYGSTALVMLMDLGDPEAALHHGLKYLEMSPHPSLAAAIGLVFFQLGRVEQAGEYLQRSQELGDDPMAIAELLEFALASNQGDPRRARDKARQMEPRRDLSAHVRKIVLEELMWDAMISGRFEEARRRAVHLNSVETNAPAQTVLRAITGRGGPFQAFSTEDEFDNAQELYYQTLALYSIGQSQEALVRLDQLREASPGFAQNAAAIFSLKEAGQWN